MQGATFRVLLRAVLAVQGAWVQVGAWLAGWAGWWAGGRCAVAGCALGCQRRQRIRRGTCPDAESFGPSM
jgi:hypothetical protein